MFGICIYKTTIIPVKSSVTDYTFLLQQNSESAKVWNRCIELDLCCVEQNGRRIKPNELQTALLGFSNLPRINVYHVYHKYLAARHGMFEAFKVDSTATYRAQTPYKTKKFFNTGWNYQGIKVNYQNGTISLCRRVYFDEYGKRRHQRPIVCHAKTIPQNIVEIELLYRNGLKLAIKYKEPDIEHLIPSGNSAAIDLGEIHSIASIDSLGDAIIITGRKLRSIKRFRDKEQAKLRSKMSRCVEWSRQYRKYALASQKLQNKTDNQIKDAIHKTTKLYLNYCIENNVTTVYYGDLDSCTRDTKQRVGRITGQKLNEWNFGKIVQQLQNKLGRYGIELIKVDESYTSQKCPSCGALNKPTNRNYTCACGYTQHRDLVGAINILNKNVGTELSRYSNKKYLRLA